MDFRLFWTIVLIAISACAPTLTEAEIVAALDQATAARTQTAELLLTGPHVDGVYRVGVEIAAGLWRPFPDGEGFCFWARRKYDGIELGSFYGLSPGDMLIREGDYEVEFDGCGV